VITAEPPFLRQSSLPALHRGRLIGDYDLFCDKPRVHGKRAGGCILAKFQVYADGVRREVILACYCICRQLPEASFRRVQRFLWAIAHRMLFFMRVWRPGYVIRFRSVLRFFSMGVVRKRKTWKYRAACFTVLHNLKAAIRDKDERDGGLRNPEPIQWRANRPRGAAILDQHALAARGRHPCKHLLSPAPITTKPHTRWISDASVFCNVFLPESRMRIIKGSTTQSLPGYS
jgi:hypothetical protein